MSKDNLVNLFPRTIVPGEGFSVEAGGETRSPSFVLLNREQVAGFREHGKIEDPTAVIEVLGDSVERHFLQGQELRRFYAKRNMACLVLWEEDLHNHFDEVERRVINYVSRWRRGGYQTVKDQTPGLTVFDLFNPGEVIKFEDQIVVRTTPDVIRPKRMKNNNPEPLLTVLNFSGGKQSSVLLWMVLRGDLPKPENFLVVTADPGMENSETYDYIQMMHEQCREHGIEAHVAKGPNLYEDLINLKGSGKTRFDNPAFWAKKANGKVGQLMQKCTRIYKIAPMDRFLRIVLEERYGLGRKSSGLGANIVEKWIGFSKNEEHRVKPSQQKYICFRYPLIELGMTNTGVLDYYKKHGLPIPPRSVCNACWANGLDTFKQMYEERPHDWEQAVSVDNAIRDLSQIMVEEEIYVSRTCLPLEQLPDIGFRMTAKKDNSDQWSCDSGYCFV